MLIEFDTFCDWEGFSSIWCISVRDRFWLLGDLGELRSQAFYFGGFLL